MGKITFYNLLDVIIALEKQGKKSNGEEMFQKILCEYFFKKECDEKKFFAFLKGFESPSFIKGATSLGDIDITQFDSYVNGSGITDSLCAKIMLSKPYLKTFHQNHQPEFAKMPADIQGEILDEIKAKNNEILNAFAKMARDREADQKRTITVLVALILKNIQIRTGLPFTSLKKSADSTIRGIFRDAHDVFTATKPQVAELNDDRNIKALIKEFFIIRRNQDLTEITNLFRKELERYKIRAEHSVK